MSKMVVLTGVQVGSKVAFHGNRKPLKNQTSSSPYKVVRRRGTNTILQSRNGKFYTVPGTLPVFLL